MKLVKKNADLVGSGPLYAIRDRTAFAFSCYKFSFFNEVLFFLVEKNRTSLQQQGVLSTSNGNIERKKN